MNEQETMKRLQKMEQTHSIAYRLMKDLPCEDYFAVVAMLIEEKCKAESIDAVETFEYLWKVSKEVNEELGKY